MTVELNIDTRAIANNILNNLFGNPLPADVDAGAVVAVETALRMAFADILNTPGTSEAQQRERVEGAALAALDAYFGSRDTWQAMRPQAID